MDYKKFIEKCKKAPRFNEMKDFFAKTAAGIEGKPLKQDIIANKDFFYFDKELIDFSKEHKNLQGKFDKHYFASIPYMLEEECRMGASILRYGKDFIRERQSPLLIYTLGTAEATMARTISKLAKGNILTFSCSPTKENEESFYSYGIPKYSTFFVGPFYEVNKNLLESNYAYSSFKNGFDIIIEDTTFQMCDNNREEQIEFVLQNLKKDGIFIFIEKFKCKDLNEYIKRENQKDFDFKIKYFSEQQIYSKRKDILSVMNNFEVDIDGFTITLQKYFKHAVLTWNSGNFYIVIASNLEKRLVSFLKKFPPVCIPKKFCYRELPQILFGVKKENISWRNVEQESFVAYN